jgi:hypothetical protein
MAQVDFSPRPCRGEKSRLRKVVDSGYPEVITLQYNLLDRQLEDGIAYAHEKGIGVVVMGPVGGGRLGVSSRVFEEMLPDVGRVPELALRFVLANPNVSVALSGMSEMQHVEENLATAAGEVRLSPEDLKNIGEHLERLKGSSDLYCSGCGYCKPCPSGVEISQIFGLYNETRTYDLWDHGRKVYAGLTRRGKAADRCGECGECVDKCPQHIPIPERLKEAHKALTEAG